MKSALSGTPMPPEMKVEMQVSFRLLWDLTVPVKCFTPGSSFPTSTEQLSELIEGSLIPEASGSAGQHGFWFYGGS